MTLYRAAADQGHTAAKARVEQTQQCAKVGADQKQQEEEKSLELREDIEFARVFQKVLREVAANAAGALNRDPVIASTEFSCLYSPAEIVSGISAAEDAGLSVENHGRAAALNITLAANARPAFRDHLSRRFAIARIMGLSLSERFCC
jgi:hypothetical protein